MKILIVDDMEVNLELLEARLEGSGYEVASAKNGIEALERLKKDSFDMIISDILMPKMDGFQLCRECKKDETLRKIPFIFYTATYTDKKDEEFALSLGAEKFIVKPAESKSFMEIIEGIFKNYKKGLLAPSKIPVEEEDIYLKEYNERLINKLEKKMLDLESEIIERKLAEEHIKHLNNVLRAIRGVNQLIIREKDCNSLLQKACDTLIEARGYDSAWLGFLSDEKKFATLKGSGFREDVSRFSEYVIGGYHPPCIKNALAQKNLLMIVDKSKVCGDCFFKNSCIGKEAAITRIEHANRLFGLLAILFAPDVTADEEEKGLLKEVAGDIAFALHNMEMEEERKQGEQALRERTYELGERVKELGCLYNIARLIEKQGISLEEILQSTVNLIPAAFQYPEIACARIILEGKEVRTENFREATWKLTQDIRSHGESIGTLEASYLEQRPEGDESPFIKEEINLLTAIAERLGHVIERKHAEEALMESEEKYRLLVEHATDAIFIAQDEVVKFPNPGAEGMIGYSAEELAAISFTDLIHPEDTNMVRDRYRRGLKGESLLPTTSFRVINKAGEELWVQLNIVAITWEGRPATLNFLRDITAQKKLEAQLQQSQKMEAIGTLAGGIAHDFNNILSLIMGYTELSMMNLPEDSPVRDSMNKLFKAGERARDLVKQILTFSRQREEEKKAVQIYLIVKEVLKLLRPSLPTTIEIRQNIASTGMVMADPTQMHQVIMNLSTNAYHAMQEKGGVLEVSLTDIELDSDFTARHLDTHPGPYIRLIVSDTGHGIEKKDIDRIFEPYYTTKEKTGGTGMGLAVVHGIVKSYSGAITVYSEPGKGTTFNVFLPRIEEVEGVAETEPRPGRIPTGNEQILFVDDEPAIVDIGKGMLENLGYTVEVRTSPIEALEAFKAKPEKFDLIITDMTMPKMTGDELAKELMAIRPDIPIILCTGFSERINEEKAKAMGIRKLVMKPVVQREMAEAVREALDQPSTF